jgi:transposase
MSSLSRKDLEKKTKSTLVDLILSLSDEVQKLTKQVEVLNEQNKKNSRNSSKPPSTDKSRKGEGNKNKDKPSPKSSRKNSGKKKGGQKGHQGSNLKPVEDPDYIEDHKINNAKCGCGGKINETGYKSRQVFDIPPINIEVTEHRAFEYECSCCNAKFNADFPREVASRTQYGERVKSIAVYLSNYQLIPYARLKEFFKDICAVSLSTGTLANFNKTAGKLADPVKEKIKSRLLEQSLIHSDETGCHVDRQRHWLHVTSCKDFTHYHIDLKRGSEAMERIGILPIFKEYVIHDHFSAYYKFDHQHGLCNAHHLRDLTFIYEEKGQSWANSMISILLDAKQQKEESSCGYLKSGSKAYKNIEARYQECLELGYATNPEPKRKPGQRGRLGRGKSLNLVRRFDEHKSSILGFATSVDIPFDNNLAERDLRMMKVREKISGTFRSQTHPGFFTSIRSMISTTKKQGLSVFKSLTKLISRDPTIYEDLRLTEESAE